jgi:hypothetical protein
MENLVNNPSNPLEEPQLQNPQPPLDYIPQSECRSVETIAPKEMRYEMLKAMELLNRRVGGVDKYVAEKLGYINTTCSKDEFKAGLMCLCNAFSAEQIDGLALAIWNIENRNQGIIVGDQTGVGKGRIAAGMVKYALNNGKIPIFITEKPNLFSDIYRDLIDINADDGVAMQYKVNDETVLKSSLTKRQIEQYFGNEDDEDEEGTDKSEEEEEDVYVTIDYYKPNNNYLKDIQGKKRIVPFILNGKEPKTDVKDSMGNIIYQGLPSTNKDYISSIENGTIPKGFDFVMATYSQFSKEGKKRPYLQSIAPGAILIMDESHNASGDSKLGIFLKKVIVESGVCFLSATYAKRPDNLPIYALKTAMSEINSTESELVEAVKSGGPALQEIISSQLVSEGQMIRRERSYAGIDIRYMTLNETQTEEGNPQFNLADVHKAVSDRITEIVREIIDFQIDFIQPAIEEMDEEAKAEYQDVKERKGTEFLGVSNAPPFSGIFQLVSQMLFSIKAEAVAEIAIKEMKEGRKPVIAFANTMESFLDTVTNDDGSIVDIGDEINADFRFVLEKRLKSVLKYTISAMEINHEDEDEDEESGQKAGVKGKSTIKPIVNYGYINPANISEECEKEYKRILNKIKEISTGITFSPIDVLIDRITKAGFTVGEVTGRKKKIEFIGDNNFAGRVVERKKVFVNDAFREFNENKTDCLLINQAGSTGASAHAIKIGDVQIVTENPPTSLLPKNEVKQRTMIVLQPELDINKEMQKRGRINRTGQFFKPRYIYVASDIPAERRLMMMLKRKLKSLDANTSGNQNQQNDILKSEDFLNKYGDELVTDWIKANPLINSMIGDPLKMEDKEKDKSEDSKTPAIPDAALKISGRVAILSTKDQDDFYRDILESYHAKIQYLIETDTYDLEVDKVDLEAETESKMIADPGRGGKSVFGRQSILEKCSVNNLKKPYTKTEVEALLNNALKDEDGNPATAQQIQEKIIAKFNAYISSRIETETDELNVYYDELIANIPNERKYLKFIREEQGSLAEEFLRERTQQLENSKEIAMKRINTKYNSVRKGLGGYFSDFTIGKVLAYPMPQDPSEFYKAIFLGFSIDERAKNPFAPSNVKLKIAIAGPDRTISIPASNYQIIDSIVARTSGNIYGYERSYTLQNWDELIRSASTSRTTRYIVTGNILQAFSKEQYRSGKLISYTTIDKGVKKGILLPLGFNPDASPTKGTKPITVTVPIMLAMPIIRGMVSQRMIETNIGMSIFRKGYDYVVFIPKAKQKDIYKFQEDESLKAFTTTGYFEPAGSSRLKAVIPYDRIENLCEYIDYKFRASVFVSRIEFDNLDIEVDEYDDEKLFQPEVNKFIEGLEEEKEEQEAEKEETPEISPEDSADDLETTDLEEMERAEEERLAMEKQMNRMKIAGMFKDLMIEMLS